MIRAYILNQELADKQLDQMQLSSRPHKLQSTVPESFITAFGGSPSNPQLCWGLLAATELNLPPLEAPLKNAAAQRLPDRCLRTMWHALLGALRHRRC